MGHRLSLSKAPVVLCLLDVYCHFRTLCPSLLWRPPWIRPTCPSNAPCPIDYSWLGAKTIWIWRSSDVSSVPLCCVEVLAWNPHGNVHQKNGKQFLRRRVRTGVWSLRVPRTGRDVTTWRDEVYDLQIISPTLWLFFEFFYIYFLLINHLWIFSPSFIGI